MSVKPWKREQVIGTRRHLIETATRLFGERGYAETPLERVVAEAGLTRGAVYHHFKDKQALFEAVVDALLGDRVIEVEKRATRLDVSDGPAPSRVLELLVEALRDPTAARVVCVDGRAVLGAVRFREVLEARLLAPVTRVLEDSAAAGVLDRTLIPALAHLVFALVEQAALDPGGRTQETDGAFRWAVERLLEA